MADIPAGRHASAAPPYGSAESIRRLPQWLRLLGAGLVLWALTAVVTFYTGNINLLPTIILLGSFLVPVTFVAWAFGRVHARDLDIGQIAQAFLVGGVLGVLAASMLEAYFLSPSPFLYVGVGLIEELVKALALVFVSRKVAHRTLRNGLVLGAAVGFGFAGFETAGYAMTSLLTVEGMSLRALIETEILRSVLAPLGHGLWTAILGGVIFSATRNGHWRLTRNVVTAYVGVVILHALWDSMSMIAIYVTAQLTYPGWATGMWENGFLTRPTDVQVHLYTAINWIGLILVSTIGLFWLGTLRRRVAVEERHQDETERLRERMQAAAEAEAAADAEAVRKAEYEVYGPPPDEPDPAAPPPQPQPPPEPQPPPIVTDAPTSHRRK
jgi:protease PrsW